MNWIKKLLSYTPSTEKVKMQEDVKLILRKGDSNGNDKK